MDARRGTLPVPRVRHVGFAAPNAPARSQLGPPGTDFPAAGNSLPPVMIRPPRHLSGDLHHHLPTSLLPVPEPSRRQAAVASSVVVGSYDPSESLLGSSPQNSNVRGSAVDGEYTEDMSRGLFQRSGSGKFELAETNPVEKSGRAASEMQDEQPSSSKPLKARTTRAERRALQESQRAAKAAGKGFKSDVVPEETASNRPAKQQSSQKKDVLLATSVITPTTSLIPSDRKGGEYPTEKERKKDVPQPRMQFDDKSRVEKAKRRAVVNQTESRNRVELFRHLPQYECGNQLPDLESKIFQLDPMHPAVYKVGLQYLSGDISGGNARCIAMLRAFQEVIRDYCTPPEKLLNRDLNVKVSNCISFFIECRPLSMSMANAIRFLKDRISKLPLTLTESEAKASVCSDIDRFIKEKIVLAETVIVGHAVTKIRDGDVLLTYGSPCVVEMILLRAHDLGKQFRVVIVDSRPRLEGQALLRRLVAKGLDCTYTHINAVSYIVHEVTRVLLGASSILSNGTVYSRVGTACVAMVAHAFRVPVLTCCEAYKFHERVQLDSICSNELGDPEAIAKVPGNVANYLENLLNKENLQLLNLMYDATPSEYISMIITDYGMIPPTSIPVIVREYRRENLWM